MNLMNSMISMNPFACSIYYLTMSAVMCLRLLPLKWVARLGRCFGGVAYHLDRRHRRRAIVNLKMIFEKEWSDTKIIALAKEHFRRLGENYCCAIRSAYLSDTQLKLHLEIETHSLGSPFHPDENCVVAIGHFGNFELFARAASILGFRNVATTYRDLKNAGANRVMQTLRRRSRITYFEKRTDADALKKRLQKGNLLLGLLSDHHAGRGGILCDFLGHPCSASPAPAILAQRYHATLFSAICYRVDLAKWRIVIGQKIPIQNEGRRRSIQSLTQEIQDALSEAVLKDPANWFWVHHRWRNMEESNRRKNTKSTHHKKI